MWRNIFRCTGPPASSSFLTRRPQQLRRGLDLAETRLTDFTRDGGVVSAQMERDLTLQKASELDASLTQTRAAIAETEQRIRTLEQQIASIPPRMVRQQRTSDNPQLLQQMKSTLLTLELKRTELLSKFDPTYRPVQEIEKQIRDTRAAIEGEKNAPVRDETTDQDPTYEWVKSELVKAEAELSGLKARATANNASLARYRSGARTLQQAAIAQQDLLQTAKTEEENYLLYLRKEEEARINDALDRGGILNVAIAELPTVPALPARSFWLYGLLSVFCGRHRKRRVGVHVGFPGSIVPHPGRSRGFSGVARIGLAPEERKVMRCSWSTTTCSSSRSVSRRTRAFYT